MTTQHRTRTVLTLATVTMASIFFTSAPVHAQTILFADNFDRDANANLNASFEGKSGTLGALDWVQLGNGGGTEIDANQLKGGDNGAGAGWAVAYPDHNFVDAGIASGGGFSVSIDLLNYRTNGSGRWMTIAVGHSKAEIDSWATNNGTSTVSDLFVGYRWTKKKLEVYDNGTLVADPDISAYPVEQTMRVDYALSDFNEGSEVDYEAYLGEDLITSGSFTWSGTDENYIGIFTNLTVRQARMDNLEISSFADAAPLGDADGDGDVDAADYIMVKTHFGGPPAAGTDGSGGDFNDNGTVDWDDLQTLMEGMNGSTVGAPVPEPATLGLLAVGALAVLRRRRAA